MTQSNLHNDASAPEPGVSRAESLWHRCCDRIARAVNAIFAPKEPVTARWAPGVLFVALVLWGSLMAFPERPAGNTLDPSWQQALAHAAKNNLQAGVDYIFTFGPLGRFMDNIYEGHGFYFTVLYDPDIFYSQIAWEVVINLFLAGVLIAVTLRLPGALQKAVFLLVAAVILPVSKDALYLFSIVAVTLPAIRESRRFTVTAAALLFLAVVALMKFTFFTLACIAVLAVFVWMCKRRSWKAGIAVIAAYAVFLALAWIAAGQALWNLPQYVRGSLEITRGYSEAMALEGSSWQVILAVCILALAAGQAVISCLVRPLELGRFAAAAVVAAAFAVAWKTGFVRQDLHAFIFFVFAAGAAFLIAGPVSGRRLRRTVGVMMWVQVLAATLGIFSSGRIMGYGPSNFIGIWNARVVGNVKTLLSPAATRNELDRRLREMQREFDLPRIRAAVGNTTIDLFSYEQGVVFLNGLTWHPRPVFQSYSAYTPALLAANAAFFEGDDAPRFVIFKLEPIDERFPAMEDSGALKVILRDYAPLFAEGGYLLFEKCAAAGRAEGGKVLLEREVGFNEPVDISTLDGKCLLLGLDIGYSASGKMRKFFYKAPPVFLDVRTADGQTYKFRIIPAMARSGFVIRPFFRGQEDLLGWYTGADLPRIVSFAVVLRPRDRRYFRERVAVTLTSTSCGENHATTYQRNP
ncbi:MAG: hypothetical protein J7M19_03145 [Planctomycetes bacterium]|nr:hypothetical protein [Planctomycetota bacterium]